MRKILRKDRNKQTKCRCKAMQYGAFLKTSKSVKLVQVFFSITIITSEKNFSTTHTEQYFEKK